MRALGRAGEAAARPEPLADEDAHEPGRRTSRPLGGVRRRSAASAHDAARIAVRRDRVDAGRSRATSRTSTGRATVAPPGVDPQRVGDALGVVGRRGERKKSSLSAARPRSATARRPAARRRGQLASLPAGEVLGQEAPDLVVDRLVAAADRPAHHALAPEAEVGDDLLRRHVGGRDLGVDPVRVVLVEGVDAGLALGLAGDALAPGRRVADQHRELRAGLAIEAEQGDEADRLGRAVDR